MRQFGGYGHPILAICGPSATRGGPEFNLSNDSYLKWELIDEGDLTTLGFILAYSIHPH